MQLVFVVILGYMTTVLFGALAQNASEKAAPALWIKGSGNIEPFAQLLLDNINETADPCQDFYQYACGKFTERETAPGHTEKSNIKRLEAEVLQQLIQQLNLLVNATDPLPVTIQATVSIYRSCLQPPVDYVKTVRFAQNELQKLGSWPLVNGSWQGLPNNENVFMLMAVIQRNYAFHSLLSSKVRVDLKHVERHALVFSTPNLPFSKNPRVIDGYVALVMQLLQFKVVANQTMFRMDMDHMVELLTRLRATLDQATVKRNRAEDYYNPFDLPSMQQRWPHILWVDYLKTLLRTNSAESIGGLRFVVEKPEQIDVVDRFFGQCNASCQRTLISYLLMTSLQLWIEIFALPQNGSSEKYCAEFVRDHMPFAVGRLYIGDDYPLAKISGVRSLMSAVLEAFRKRLKQLLWMDAASKQNALLKVKHMVRNVAYPEWIMDEEKLNALYENLTTKVRNWTSFDRNYHNVMVFEEQTRLYSVFKRPTRQEFHGSPAKVDAYYVAQSNSLTIPAAIMNPIFFSVDYPNVTKFAALGHVISHELTHAIDAVSIEYFWNGSLYNWMSNDSQHGFHAMADCVAKQYAHHCYSTTVSRVCIDGNKTLSENIADNGGLRTAYSAYQNHVEIHGEDPRIAGLENYTMNQIFFLYYAQVWCQSYDDELLTLQLNIDPHSPADARVLEVVRNMPRFGSAFRCKLGDPMMPVDRCEVW